MSSHSNQQSQLGQKLDAQSRRVFRKGPGSGVSRASSMRDVSTDDGPYMAEWRSGVSKKVTASGVSRASSMRSDRSKEDGPYMVEGKRLSRKGPRSIVSSAPSMRSDVSKEEPPFMAEGGRLFRKGPGSGVSRAPSMRSDVSKRDGPYMTAGERLSRKGTGFIVSKAPSMRSDVSKDDPPDMAEWEREQVIGYQPDTGSEDTQRDLLHIFEVLEKNIITFLKEEIQRYKQILRPDYQENFEMKAEDESDAREGALKMALHFLCKMEHQDLADKLNENELNVICQNDLKRNLKAKYQNVFEGMAKHGRSVLLQTIYTDLYITEGGSGRVNEEHEVRQIESRSKSSAGQDKPIKCNDIFRSSPRQDKPIRRVLTKGVAGIGKTISVHKYILDWAEGNDNQEINFIFPLCFRELNLMKEKEWSLMGLLHHFFPEIKQLTIGSQKKYKVLFVFDGLDECRLQLNFQKNESLSDVRGITTLDVILTNLLKGNLFPPALLWITSRPAAASQIPPDCFDLLTEVQGFNDSQKEDYFRKRIKNETLAREIISHIKSSRSLHIMCHIPVFCWIAAMVLEMIYSSGLPKIPKTLTEMYTYFLIFQTRQRNIKFDNVHDLNTQWNHELILQLGKLAYEQLEKGNLIFYDEDLRGCGIDVQEATVFSGMCTQIFREESGIFLGTVFCFVHLSIQEYLAALYAFLMMTVEKKDIISTHHSRPRMKSMITLQKSAVDKALAYEDGRFDLFLRFLLGLSLESNQTHLHGLMSRRQMSFIAKIRTFMPIRQIHEETSRYIKDKIREASSSERVINLFHCLNELNDHSLVEEIQSFLSAGTLSEVQLTPGQWSALVFVLLTSDQNLDVFDLKKYVRSNEALLRLKPVLEESHTTLVDSCGLTDQSCTTLATILCKESSKLRHLDLSDNHIGDVGVQLLCRGLKSPNCALETLRVDSCGLTAQSCTTLATILSKESSKLRHLDLSDKHIGDVGVQLLCTGLESPNCALETLRADSCGLTKQSCTTLASVLCKESSKLRHLDLNDNLIGDDGVKLLCSGLSSPNCALETLRVTSCGLSEQSCVTLAPVLCKESSKLRHLDLNDNLIGDDGVKLLCSGLSSPNCALETLRIKSCGLTEQSCKTLATILCKESSKLRHLDLTDNHIGNYGVQLLCRGLESPLETLRLSDCGVTGGGYAALASALKSNPSHLEELDLRGNDPGNTGVKLLTDLLKDPQCKLKRLRLLKKAAEAACMYLTSVLGGNPLLLTKLVLSGKIPGDSGVKQFCPLLEDSHCRIKSLSLIGCRIREEGCAALTSALTLNPSSHLAWLDLSKNKLGDCGVKQISALLINPDCKLQTLWLSGCSITAEGCADLTSALTSNPSSRLRHLYLFNNKLRHLGLKQIALLQSNPDCKVKIYYTEFKSVAF